MQISGEPLRRGDGPRSRRLQPRPPARPTSTSTRRRTRRARGSTSPGSRPAVESYEYSKQPMNNVAFESGAGTSLAHGAARRRERRRRRARRRGARRRSSSTSPPAATRSGRFVFPAGTFPANNASGDANPDGRRHRRREPARLARASGRRCTSSRASTRPSTAERGHQARLRHHLRRRSRRHAGALGCADYECDATTLHLADRAPQIDPTHHAGRRRLQRVEVRPLGPELPAGHARLDRGARSRPSTRRTSRTSARRATSRRRRRRRASRPPPGTYLGSSDIEGFQAQMFIAEIDNRAEDWLDAPDDDRRRARSPASPTLNDALAYDYELAASLVPRRDRRHRGRRRERLSKPSYALRSAEQRPPRSRRPGDGLRRVLRAHRHAQRRRRRLAAGARVLRRRPVPRRRPDRGRRADAPRPRARDDPRRARRPGSVAHRPGVGLARRRRHHERQRARRAARPSRRRRSRTRSSACARRSAR